MLKHGGSLANLTALIAARTRLAPEVWEQGNPADLAILAPTASHYSVARAAGILGLRFFAVLAALGERGLAAYVERQYRVTREAYELIAAQPDFECAAAPQSNILCFRQKGDDERQMALRARILAEGGFYLSTAVHGGRRWLRLVFMNPDTGLAEVRRLLERLRAAG